MWPFKKKLTRAKQIVESIELFPEEFEYTGGRNTAHHLQSNTHGIKIGFYNNWVGIMETDGNGSIYSFSLWEKWIIWRAWKRWFKRPTNKDGKKVPEPIDYE